MTRLSPHSLALIQLALDTFVPRPSARHSTSDRNCLSQALWLGSPSFAPEIILTGKPRYCWPG